MNISPAQRPFLSTGFFLTVFLWSSWTCYSIADEVVVIINKENPTTVLASGEVSNLYLGRSRSFPGGGPAHVMDQPRDSPLRAHFYQHVNGMSLNQVNTYWARLTFSGRVLPPVVQADAPAALQTVAEDPKAISYVGESVLKPSVSPVLRLHD